MLNLLSKPVQCLHSIINQFSEGMLKCLLGTVLADVVRRYEFKAKLAVTPGAIICIASY